MIPQAYRLAHSMRASGVPVRYVASKHTHAPARNDRPVRPKAPPFIPNSKLHRDLDAFDGWQRLRFCIKRFGPVHAQTNVLSLVDRNIEELQREVKIAGQPTYDYLQQLSAYNLHNLTSDELGEVAGACLITESFLKGYGYPSEATLKLRRVAETCEFLYKEKSKNGNHNPEKV